jgi:hypothetical protein
MSIRTRRELFGDVGRGMIAATVGTTLASELGFPTALAAEDSTRLTFGKFDPLVNFLQETPPDKLLAKTIAKLKNGETTLKDLVSAAALTNARAFGGEDYVGFHTLMALAPAFQMAQEERDESARALPILKVLYRNATRTTEVGHKKETLSVVKPGDLPNVRARGETLRDDCRKADLATAETTFATICAYRDAKEALNELLVAVDDATEVHRVVLVSRAWDLTRFVGEQHAHTLLRQSVHYCVNIEKNPNQVKFNAPLREQLPKLLDQHRLLATKSGTKLADDAWVSKFADTLFTATPAQAADAVAAALAEGIRADAIGESLSLAANQLVLRDEGRLKAWAQPNKPEGSVHGDSIGVHACDTIHAWRNLAAIGDRRTEVTSLILAGYQVARDRTGRAEFTKWEPYPRGEHSEKVRSLHATALLKELDGAIREKDQQRAAAITARIGAELPKQATDVFALLRKYAISEDGALHAEKYYATASDEFGRARAAFKWRQLVALARVTASAYGYPSPAHKDACELLKG